MTDKIIHDALEVLHAHEENQGSYTRGDLVPVHLRLFLGGILVARYESNARGVITMGKRNAGIGRNRCGSSHAGNDLKGNAIVDEFLGFLPAPCRI